jgi:peptidoglycan/xylan/chitin deacetylase (PgdA/CDA1 family)
MRPLLATLVYMLAEVSGLNHLFRLRNKNKIRVLMYHGVTSRNLSVPCWTVLNVVRFEQHMSHLKRHYRCLSTDEMLSTLSDTHTGFDNGAFITFDDGLLNTASEAEPILTRYNLTACCFVCPGLSEHGEIVWADRVWEGIVEGTANQLDFGSIGGDVVPLPPSKPERARIAGDIIERMKGLPHEERQKWLETMRSQGAIFHTPESPFALLSLENIKSMADRGNVTVASHTMNHPILATQSLYQQKEEIAACQRTLEDAGIQSYPLFAYPNGRPERDYTGETVELVKQAGFVGAFVTSDGLFDESADRFQVPRIAIGYDTNIWEFNARMSGLYYAMKRLNQ